MINVWITAKNAKIKIIVFNVIKDIAIIIQAIIKHYAQNALMKIAIVATQLFFIIRLLMFIVALVKMDLKLAN